jgi:hypothetical protein
MQNKLSCESVWLKIGTVIQHLVKASPYRIYYKENRPEV